MESLAITGIVEAQKPRGRQRIRYTDSIRETNRTQRQCFEVVNTARNRAELISMVVDVAIHRDAL